MHWQTAAGRAHPVRSLRTQNALLGAKQKVFVSPLASTRSDTLPTLASAYFCEIAKAKRALCSRWPPNTMIVSIVDMFRSTSSEEATA